MLSYRWTVSALTYTIIADRCQGGPQLLFPHNRVARFVTAQQQRMPDCLRLPMRILTLLFDAASMVRTGRPFHRLCPHGRLRRVQTWKQSRFALCRDLIRFYENLVIFGYYAECYG